MDAPNLKLRRCGADTQLNGHATYPSAVVSHRSSLGSSTSFRPEPSAAELRTITSGRVDDGALMTSLSVIKARRLHCSWADELASPAPPATPTPGLPTGATPVPGTLELRLDLALDIDADMVGAKQAPRSDQQKKQNAESRRYSRITTHYERWIGVGFACTPRKWYLEQSSCRRI